MSGEAPGGRSHYCVTQAGISSIPADGSFIFTVEEPSSGGTLVGTMILREWAASFDNPRRSHASIPKAWRYRERPDGRDLRIDLVRGVAITAVVVDHLAFWRPASYSFIHLATVERVGPVSAAELFVLLSGLVIGLVHRRRIEVDGWATAARHLAARSFLLYRVAVIGGVSFWLLGFVPRHSSELFPRSSLDDLRSTAADVVLLRQTPPHLNILGLYVLLLALAPALLWLLCQNRTLELLTASGLLWVVATMTPRGGAHVTFGGPFPLLSWQLLFVIGLAVGYHRIAFETRLSGRRLVTIAAAAIVTVGVFVTMENSNWAGLAGRGRSSMIPPETYDGLWRMFFVRETVGLGRAADTVALAALAYVVLTRWWGILEPVCAWFFVPLGQASLYIYLLHPVIALALEQFGALHAGRYALNTLAHVAVLAGLWLLVRHRVLFRWIPR
jgi:hypothetical protein